jgi:hypothetical protein
LKITPLGAKIAAMSEEPFTEVIASAQKRASDRAIKNEEGRKPLLASIKTKQEVLHTIVNSTLHKAWRDLEAAGVKAAVETDVDSRGDWRIALRVLSKPNSAVLVFTVQVGMGAHLVYSREYGTKREEVDYRLIDDATPLEVARIVAEYLSDTLG